MNIDCSPQGNETKRLNETENDRKKKTRRYIKTFVSSLKCFWQTIIQNHTFPHYDSPVIILPWTSENNYEIGNLQKSSIDQYIRFLITVGGTIHPWPLYRLLLTCFYLVFGRKGFDMGLYGFPWSLLRVPVKFEDPFVPV